LQAIFNYPKPYLLRISMKKVLIAGLVFWGSCKSTESVRSLANSCHAGMREISQAPRTFGGNCRLWNTAFLCPDSVGGNWRINPDFSIVPCGEYAPADSLLSFIVLTLDDYFSVLVAKPDKNNNRQQLMKMLRSLPAGQLPGGSGSGLTADQIYLLRQLLTSMVQKPLKKYSRSSLIDYMQRNDTPVLSILRLYSRILDSALLGEIRHATRDGDSLFEARWSGGPQTPAQDGLPKQSRDHFLLIAERENADIRLAVRMLTLMAKDHHMLAYGTPPTGFAYRTTKEELKEDEILLGESAAELKERRY
jgi:hypothetical protein